MKMSNDDNSVEMLFTPGSVISVTTGLKQSLTGEVLSFDYERKVIIIKLINNNKPGHSDVHLINLNTVADVSMVKDGKPHVQQNNHVNNHNNANNLVQSINIKKVQDKLSKVASERKALAKACAAGVPENGLRLYLNLCKTIGRDSVHWSDMDLIVNSVVKIEPPYNTDCVHGNADGNNKMVDYVKQLVGKFWDSQTRMSPSKDANANAKDTTDTAKDGAKDKEAAVGGQKKNGRESLSVVSPTPSNTSSSGGDGNRGKGSKQQGGGHGGKGQGSGKKNVNQKNSNNN